MIFISLVAEVVVSLDALDEFLKSRVMNLPESVVAGTHNTEEGKLLSSIFLFDSFLKVIYTNDLFNK